MKNQIPVLKFSKRRRRDIKITKLWDKQNNKLQDGFGFGLVALEGGILYLAQMKMLVRTVAKYAKKRERLSKKDRIAKERRLAEQKGKVKIKKGEDLNTIRIKDRKRVTKFIASIFPKVSYTKKPLGTRMGKGKGAIDRWGFVVKRGRIIIQLTSVLKAELALRCLKQLQYRLPFKSSIIIQEQLDKQRGKKLGYIKKN